MRGRPFQPGQSGNAGGRPKIVGDVRNLAREHTATAIETLIAVMTSTKSPAAARVAAANSLLDRAVGKPISPPPLNFELLEPPFTSEADDPADDEIAF